MKTRMITLMFVLLCRVVAAQNYSATPANYTSMLSLLAPGDTLTLGPGNYINDLNITNRNGNSGAWITIQGPTAGPPAVFLANLFSNTVEIRNSSFVAVKNLTLDGQHLDGPFGVSANGGTSNLVHDILIENNIIQNYDGSQQIVGVSTKAPTWNWTIRRNRIINAGTGIYLGNSNGTLAFVNGIIEENLVLNPIGYCMQIKHQFQREVVAGMPTGICKTIIRNNVFIKNDAPSPDGDRPNLLVDGFPDTGAGSLDRYEIYGNFLCHNPRESLMQVSGRVTIHDNVLVDVPGTAILLQNHNLPLKLAYVYNNTIYSAGQGIRFNSTASQGDAVRGNLVFSAAPIGGTIGNNVDNLTASVASAANYVVNPSINPGSMDFYPKAGGCVGSAVDMTPFQADTDFDRDFNGTSKGAITFRGAYSGDTTNPGWQLQVDLKSTTTTGGTSPLITVQPQSLTVVAGQSASFSVTATGGAPLSYQWLRNGTVIIGATNATFTIAVAVVADNGAVFSVKVQNSSGIATSAGAMLTVTSPSGGTANPDRDGDGFPDAVELAAGSNPDDPNSTPFSGAPAPVAQALNLDQLIIKLDFTRANDSITMKGALPVPAGFSATGMGVLVDVGGVAKNFSLNEKGQSTPKGNDTFSFTGKPKGGLLKFRCKAAHGEFDNFFTDEKIAGDGKRAAVAVNVSIYFNGGLYTSNKSLSYSGKAGRTGSAR